MKTKLRVGVIGLGLMGKPMAENILKKGFHLTVFNRTSSKVKPLTEKGAVAVKTPAEVAKLSDVVITMVTASSDVNDVLFGKNGVTDGAHKDLIVVDMSTIGPTAAKEIANKLQKKNIEFLDAPVTGSTPKAITGELTIFVGGDEKVFETVKPVFEAMGTNIQYMGGVGSGQAIKLINNHLIAASIIALAEGMILADAMKISRHKIAEVLKTVPAMSPYMNLKVSNFVKNEFPLLFSAANMKKDIKLALQEAVSDAQHLPILEQVVQLYEKASASNLSEADMSAVIKVIGKK